MAYINVNEVYILDNTGLQVDMATDIPFADAGFSDAQKEQARANIGAGGTNPNLLDNPFFTVRQRGNGPFNGAVYTVDRWKLSSAYITATVNADKTITLTKTSGGSGVFLQVLEQYDTTRTYTLSVMDTSGNIYTHTGTFDGTFTAVTIDGVSVRLYLTAAGQAQIYAANATAGSFTIKAVKLELGSVSTLANDAPPDYGMELLKCRYYFRRIQATAAGGLGMAYASSATRADWIDYTQGVPMRPTTTPTATFNGTLNLYNGSNHAVSAIYAIANGTQYNLRLDTTGLTANQALIFSAGGAAYIDISHDI